MATCKCRNPFLSGPYLNHLPRMAPHLGVGVGTTSPEFWPVIMTRWGNIDAAQEEGGGITAQYRHQVSQNWISITSPEFSARSAVHHSTACFNPCLSGLQVSLIVSVSDSQHTLSSVDFFDIMAKHPYRPSKMPIGCQRHLQ